MGFPFLKSQSSIVLSGEPEKNSFPSGENVVAQTPYEWPVKVATFLNFWTSQSLINLS
jgi:hypothetical protein